MGTGADARDTADRLGTTLRSALVPQSATLQGFVSITSALEGIHLREVPPLTTLLVQTRNSQYRIIVLQGTSVLIQGGAFFPDPTRAHLSGSGFGGSLLKVAWIVLGLRMEISVNEQRIVTSDVREIAAERPAQNDHCH